MAEPSIDNYIDLVNVIYRQLSRILSEKRERKERLHTQILERLHTQILFSARVLVVSLRELSNRLRKDAFAISTIDNTMTPEKRKEIAHEYASFVYGQEITPKIRTCVAELEGFLEEINDERLADPIEKLVECGREVLSQRESELLLRSTDEFFRFVREMTDLPTEDAATQVRQRAIWLSNTFNRRIIAIAEHNYGLLKGRIIIKYPLMEVPL